jgi:carbon monoxide dehydrogenase subunit G
MVSVTRTFTVDKPVSVVIEYLKDFGNAVEWDPGTQSCTRQDSGPIAVGASWHNVSKVLGRETELSYRLQTLEPDHIVLVGRNDTATSTDDIRVRPAATGSEITYHADIELHGVAKLGAPVIKVEFERLGTETVKGLTDAIGRIEQRPAR